MDFAGSDAVPGCGRRVCLGSLRASACCGAGLRPARLPGFSPGKRVLRCRPAAGACLWPPSAAADQRVRAPRERLRRERASVLQPSWRRCEQWACSRDSPSGQARALGARTFWSAFREETRRGAATAQGRPPPGKHALLRLLARICDHWGMASLDIGGLAIPERAISFRFVRSSGPGGQNVNKVATAAQCRLDLDAAGIEGPLRRRLERLAGKRLTVAGEVVVFSDTHRTQARNRAEALARLGAMIEEARAAPRPRRPTRPSAGARERRLQDKRRRGETKKRRGRVDAGDE